LPIRGRRAKNRLVCGRCFVDGQDGRPLARSTGTVWILEQRISTLQSLVEVRCLGSRFASIGRRTGLGPVDSRHHNRACPCARRRRQKNQSGGQAEQALGRSRGGFGSKLHVAVDARGVPVVLKLTAGQESDATHAGSLLGNHRPKAVIADKGYDSDRIRAHIAALGAKAVIPPLKCRKAPLKYDKRLYKDRHLAERFWSVAKQCRRVATRYDKTDKNYLGFVHVASIRYLLSLHDQERLTSVHTA